VEALPGLDVFSGIFAPQAAAAAPTTAATDTFRKFLLDMGFSVIFFENK
jgi:hypothetical protein